MPDQSKKYQTDGVEYTATPNFEHNFVWVNDTQYQVLGTERILNNKGELTGLIMRVIELPGTTVQILQADYYNAQFVVKKSNEN